MAYSEEAHVSKFELKTRKIGVRKWQADLRAHLGQPSLQWGLCKAVRIRRPPDIGRLKSVGTTVTLRKTVYSNKAVSRYRVANIPYPFTKPTEFGQRWHDTPVTKKSSKFPVLRFRNAYL